MIPRIQQGIARLLASSLLGFGFVGCDDPPQTPEPSVDLEDKQEALRENVEETRSEAEGRVREAAAKIPNDAGSTDAAGSPEQ